MAESDWKAAAEDHLALERERLGPPPSEEEVRAYLAGELSGEETERVRDLLVCYPELAIALSDPAPGAEPPAELSEHELQQNWVTLRRRIDERGTGKVEARPRRIVWIPPVAAMLVIGVATVVLLQWRWHDERERLAGQVRQPRAHGVRHTLDAMETRGAAGRRPYQLPAHEENFMLAPALVHHSDYPEYRIDIVDVTSAPPKTIWSKSGFRAHPRSGTLDLSVPRDFLPSGIYRLDVYGTGRVAPKFVASYLIQAP